VFGDWQAFDLLLLQTPRKTDMLSWQTTPVSVQYAMKFVVQTNESRQAGVAIDAAQVLACKAAALCCRSYFTRLLTAIDQGELDPISIDEWKSLASGNDDGEESDHEESEADRRCNDGTYE
jgi:hypothetical protein